LRLSISSDARTPGAREPSISTNNPKMSVSVRFSNDPYKRTRVCGADNGQCADLVVSHGRSSHLDGTVRADCDYVLLHDLAYRQGSSLGAGLYPADGSVHGGQRIQQVLLRDNADQ
jgi:hypothetical protein